MNLVNFHVYALRSPAGEPLFTARVNHRRRPYAVIESCTLPGTLTTHPVTYPQYTTATPEALQQMVFDLCGGYTMSSLYSYLADRALEHLDAQPSSSYYASRVHLADSLHCLQENYLTTAQTAALDRMTKGATQPWLGTPEFAKVQKAQGLSDSDIQPFVRVPLQEAKLLKTLTGWSPNPYEQNLLSPPRSAKDKTHVVPADKGRPGSLRALTWMHYRCMTIDRVAFMPEQLELYMGWSSTRRRRFTEERSGAPRQRLAWTHPTPYLPDTAQAHQWAADEATIMPANWSDLPPELQFDPDTPEQYRASS